MITSVRLLALAALLLLAAHAAAQTASSLDKGSGGSVPALSSSKGQAYPARPVRVIVPRSTSMPG